MSSLMYWVLAVVLFGAVITLHELGHFLGARIGGVAVVEFAVGFGPRVWSRKAKSGVLYSLRVLPLGGYCRFVADDEGGEADRPDAFSKQKLWKRALIAVSGPLLNFLTAFVLLFLLYFALGLPLAQESVIAEVSPGTPAAEAGLEAGERIVRVNGMETETSDMITQAISSSGGAAIELTLEKDGNRRTVSLAPAWNEEEGSYMIGILYTMSAVRGKPVRFGFFPSVQNALVTSGRMAMMVVDVLRDLIFKGEGMEDLSGPIGTVVAVKEMTQAGGLFDYFYLASVISVNLCLFNLLPVPGLDGSKLLFLLLEKIRGKRMNPEKEGAVLLAGFALMIAVMLLAMYQDIARLIR